MEKSRNETQRNPEMRMKRNENEWNECERVEWKEWNGMEKQLDEMKWREREREEADLDL